MTEQCPTCEGKGFVKGRVTLAHQVLREIRREMPALQEDHLYITVHPEIFAVLKSLESDTLVQLEKHYQKGIKVSSDPNFHFEQISIQGGSKNRPPARTQPLQPLAPVPKKQMSHDEPEEADEALYQADVAAIRATKEAKARAAQEAAAATTTATATSEEMGFDDDAPRVDPNASEIEAPVIRSREEAERTETVWEDEIDDEGDDTESDEPSSTDTEPPEHSKIG
jgi:hypothetical protein